MIRYVLFWRRKIQLAAFKKQTLHFQRRTYFLVKLQCLVLAPLFISYFVFMYMATSWFFFKKKFVKWKQVSIRSTRPIHIQLRYYNPLLACCNRSKNSCKHLTFFVTVFFAFSFFVTIFLAFPFTFLVIWKFIFVMKL